MPFLHSFHLQFLVLDTNCLSKDYVHNHQLHADCDPVIRISQAFVYKLNMTTCIWNPAIIVGKCFKLYFAL